MNMWFCKGYRWGISCDTASFPNKNDLPFPKLFRATEHSLQIIKTYENLFRATEHSFQIIKTYYVSAMEDFIELWSEIGDNFHICDILPRQQRERFLFRFWHRFKVITRITRRIYEWRNLKNGTTSDTYDMDEEQQSHELRCIFGTITIVV